MAEATAGEQRLWKALHGAIKRAGLAAKVRLTREAPDGFEYQRDGQILTIDRVSPVRVRCRVQRLKPGPDHDRPTTWEVHMLEGEEPAYRLNSQKLAEADVASQVLMLLAG